MLPTTEALSSRTTLPSSFPSLEDGVSIAPYLTEAALPGKAPCLTKTAPSKYLSVSDCILLKLALIPLITFMLEMREKLDPTLVRMRDDSSLSSADREG